ncbi:MAG: alkaline phosphatase family protein [Actinomycetota bacterium]|nr:alkaline phosphatase family protein [Actinomycetota bacterium]
MDSAPDPVLPRYGRSTLADLLPSIAARLGVPGCDDVLGLPAARSWVVLLIDGLGEHALDEHADAVPHLASLRGGPPLTACVPSTTATSITSLGTGLVPGRHGVVGYTSRIPGTLSLLNALTWDATVDPAEWQPHPSVFERVAKSGGRASVVSRASFEGSGLTLASQRGSTYVAVESAWERIGVVADLAETPGSLTYAYESRLDKTGHKHGCSSPGWVEALRRIDQEAAALREALPPGTGLVVTGDHGFVDVPADHRVDADAGELAEGVVLLGGEARFRHLWTVAGATDDVVAAWRAGCGNRAWVVTREEAESAGWFGPVDADVRPRIGEVLVAARGTAAVVTPSRFPRESEMVGFHGSLTAEEMNVPLLVDVVG